MTIRWQEVEPYLERGSQKSGEDLLQYDRRSARRLTRSEAARKERHGLKWEFLEELQDSDKRPEEVLEHFVRRRMKRGYSRKDSERYFARVLRDVSQSGGY